MKEIPAMDYTKSRLADLAVPVYRVILRIFLATCIVLSPVVTFLILIFNPLTNVEDPRQTIAAAASANLTVVTIHFVLNIAASYLVPLAMLGLMLLALQRSPWLAMIGGGIALLGVLPTAAFVGQDALTYDMAHLGNRAAFVALSNSFGNDPVMSFYLTFFVIGQKIGTILLAIALWRARVIPIWAMALLILGIVVQTAAFPIGSFYLEIAADILLIIGSIPAGLAMLKYPKGT